MSPQSKVAKILNGAADYIEKYGHCKGHFQDGTGACCTLGAMRLQTEYRISWAWGEGSVAAFSKHIKNGWGEAGIANWNDAPERTKEEVIAALREAAKQVD